MKYIRTKGGRIIKFICEDTETQLPRRDKLFYFVQPNKVIGVVSKDNFLQQADSIIKLCDKFIWEKEKNELYDKCYFVCSYDDYSFDKPCLWIDSIEHHFMLDECLAKGEVFGCIFTEKGLIKVAKFNKKGDLKLL